VHGNVRFQLLGPLDPNPAAVKRSELDAWIAENAVEYLGVADDVRPFIANAHAVVLPSYYGEGIPRALLEGLAMGRAIVTTDAPGCRETVRDGENGLCVPSRDVDALTTALLRLVNAPQLLDVMGAASRRLAENRFDVHKVNRTILSEMYLTDDTSDRPSRYCPLQAEGSR